MTGHALALEHTARGLALADGARRAMRHGVSVGFHAAREVVSLHGAGESLADRGAGDIDHLAHREHVDLDLTAHGERLALALLQAEFPRSVAGGHVGLGEMARQRLGDPRRAAAADGDLNGGISFGFLGFDLRNTIRKRLDDRHGDGNAGVSENAGHAAFAANQTNGHCQSSYRGSDKGSATLQQAGGLDARDPRTLGLGRP